MFEHCNLWLCAFVARRYNISRMTSMNIILIGFVTCGVGYKMWILTRFLNKFVSRCCSQNVRSDLIVFIQINDFIIVLFRAIWKCNLRLWWGMKIYINFFDILNDFTYFSVRGKLAFVKVPARSIKMNCQHANPPTAIAWHAIRGSQCPATKPQKSFTQTYVYRNAA